LISLLLQLSCIFCSTLITVLPSTTDSSISSSYDSDNYAYIPDSSDDALKSQLFFFLPGTGASPSDYSTLLQYHASLGYRVVSIDFPNEYTVNDYCEDTSSSGTCYQDVRNETLTGADSSSLVSISISESILNRFIKMLIYLQENYPSGSWSQFYNGTNINWNQIVASGHSQGSGFAAFIGVLYNCTKIIQYGGCTDLYSDGTSPSWTDWVPVTPREFFTGFRSEYEFVCSGAKSNWIQFGQPTYGSTVCIEETTDFLSSHQICSNFKPSLGVQPLGLGLYAHFDYTVDGYIQASRTTLIESVWEYLATIPECWGQCANGTFCAFNGSCIPLTAAYSNSTDPCSCDEGSLINPGFLAIVIILPVVACILIIAGIVGGVCYYKRRKARNALTFKDSKENTEKEKMNAQNKN